MPFIRSTVGVSLVLLNAYGFSISARANDFGNLLANSQFQFATGWVTVPTMNHQGTSTKANVSISRFSTGSNTVTFYTSNTNQFKVNDIVQLRGCSDTTMGLDYLRITKLTTNTSFTVNLAYGYKPRASSNNCVAHNVQPGDSLTGSGPDAWAKDVTLQGWLDTHSVNIDPGALRAVGLKKASGQQFLYQRLRPTIFTGLRGQTVTLGMRVYHKIKTGNHTCRLVINAGGLNYSTSCMSSGAYEWLALTVSIPTNATFLDAGISLDGASGDVYYISKPILVLGSTLPTNYYSQPRGERLQPLVKLSPMIDRSYSAPTSTDCSATYGFEFDFYALSGGTIDRSVPAIDMQYERVNGTVGQGDAWRNQPCAPVLFGAFPTITQVSGVKMVSGGTMPLVDGKGWYYSDTPGMSSSNASIDINGAILND